MEKFKIIIEGTHAETANPEIAVGEVVGIDMTDGHTPVSLGSVFTDKLAHYGATITSSVIVHSPEQGDQIIDDLQTGFRAGNLPD